MANAQAHGISTDLIRIGQESLCQESSVRQPPSSAETGLDPTTAPTFRPHPLSATATAEETTPFRWPHPPGAHPFPGRRAPERSASQVIRQVDAHFFGDVAHQPLYSVDEVRVHRVLLWACWQLIKQQEIEVGCAGDPLLHSDQVGG